MAKNKMMENLKDKASKAVSNIDVGAGASKAKQMVTSTKEKALDKVKGVDVSPEQILRQALKLPIAQVDRSTFLKKELIKFYPEDTVRLAIENNPAYAGIDKDTINRIATQVIQYETNKVSSISFAAGLPGGLAMAATVPADVAQYFAFILRAMQEIAYLYGFEEFDFDNENVDSNTMNEIMIFLGAMFGVSNANAGIKIIAQSAAQKMSKTLANKALTKTAIYPIVKKIAQAVGIRMTKQIFADGVARVVPILGGAVSGGLTYATFKPCCVRLQHSFWNLNLCDVEFYEKVRKGEITEMPEDEVIDINEDEIITETNEDSSEEI